MATLSPETGAAYKMPSVLQTTVVTHPDVMVERLKQQQVPIQEQGQRSQPPRTWNLNPQLARPHSLPRTPRATPQSQTRHPQCEPRNLRDSPDAQLSPLAPNPHPESGDDHAAELSHLGASGDGAGSQAIQHGTPSILTLGPELQTVAKFAPSASWCLPGGLARGVRGGGSRLDPHSRCR